MAASLLMAWVSYTRSPGLHVPPSIGYVVAAVFALTAVQMVRMIVRPTANADGFMALLSTGFAVIQGWIAFAPGNRSCSTGVGMGGGAMASHGSGASCRVPFGFGSLIFAALAIYCLVRWWRARVSVAPGA